MKNSLYKILKTDIAVLRNHASNKTEDELTDILVEHYPMLHRCLKNCISECKKIRNQLIDPKLLSGLFDKCGKMCQDGMLPEPKNIINNLHELNGIEIQYLPLALSCSLLHVCSEAITENNPERFKKAVLSVRKIREVDFDYISENLFSAEDILLSDPVGIYSIVDRESKIKYRRKIAKIAIKKNKSEREIARELLEKSEETQKHIGEHLFTTVKSRKIGMVLFISEVFIPAFICIAAGIFSSEWLVCIMLYFPIWEILRYYEESAVLAGVIPEKPLSLDPECKKVSDVKVTIVLLVILASIDRIEEIKDKMEALYLSNGAKNTKICCLADFKGADTPRKAEDRHIMNALNKSIDELNAKYGGGFIAAVRPRSYSETQNEFIGKERKRGAIRALVRAIKGSSKEFLSIHGDSKKLDETKYLFALDYDSRPVFESVRELIAVAEHPVNKPIIKDGRVISGYGILVPKIQTSLACSRTIFGNIMSHNLGISSYDECSGEKYQTLFGESIFCGKGLINVDAYYELLDKFFLKERVLSHDIIEGEILRTGFISGAQIIEDFPTTVDGYYKRQHRWIRGDWQNSGFIFGKNPLNFVSRYKLFDNLRRSIHPVICLAVMLFSAFYGGNSGAVAATVSGLSLCASDLFAGIGSVFRLGHRSVTGLYYSKRLPEALGMFAKAFTSVAYSAREAYVCTDATVRALWRMLISGNNLLEWTTSDTQDKNSGLPAMFVPALTVSAVLIVFGLPIHRLFAIIILADIPLTFFGKLPVLREKKRISASQKEYFISQASAMWGYFEDLCEKENNYLPPDNIQFAPHRAVAKRTSPTNIGLMLACFLAARDFGFITSEELNARLAASLESVEKLEKYKGNLMNWYDTSTLGTLSPRFVSAVDSGNFLCCLTAVKEGIQEYKNECPGLKSVADRIENIISDTDLSVMYNKQRKLFHTGINPDSGQKTESCYDLYMSEIRMTAYCAVARKSVPKNHWSALDRPLIKNGRYAGLASWTGTMFEYFMADIFLPSPSGSLTDEALKFCLQCQRKKAGRMPFGMSESAFYAFDGDMNYQYKAHGVQKLGLKRGLDKENVISPYSSFLTLNIAPRVSFDNLKRLEKLGLTGKYGFYEAIDYTKGRNNNGFSIINSFMVHHIGMSFLSIDNLTNSNCMQKRFMNDKNMKGAKTLLEEKPPQGRTVFKDVVSDTIIPVVRERINRKRNEWYTPDRDNPKMSLFFNGRITFAITDTGMIQIYFDGETVSPLTEVSDFLDSNKGGFYFYNSETKVKISGQSVTFKTENENLSMTMRMSLVKNINCVVVKYNLENKSKEGIFEGCLKSSLAGKNMTGCFSMYGFVDENKDGMNELKVAVSSGEKKEYIFVFAIDETEDDALNSYEKMKMIKGEFKKAVNPFYKDEFLIALSEKYLFDIAKNKAEKNRSLYELFGITMDYPVVTVSINNTEYEKIIKPLIVFNKTMRNCGIKNTLAIHLNLPEKEKTYALETIEKILHEESCDLMLGIGGGVYVFDGNQHKNSDFEKLKSESSVFIVD